MKEAVEIIKLYAEYVNGYAARDFLKKRGEG